MSQSSDEFFGKVVVEPSNIHLIWCHEYFSAESKYIISGFRIFPKNSFLLILCRCIAKEIGFAYTILEHTFTNLKKVRFSTIYFLMYHIMFVYCWTLGWTLLFSTTLGLIHFHHILKNGLSRFLMYSAQMRSMESW